MSQELDNITFSFYCSFLNYFIVMKIDKNDIIKEVTLSKKDINIKSKKSNKLTSSLIGDFKKYFKGQKINFGNYKIDISGYSTFENKVLKEVKNIPYAQEVTYRQLAYKIKSPKAYRSVGKTLNKNQFFIIIPCHRVIGKRNIGGFKYPIIIKKKLLKLEQKIQPQRQKNNS